MNENRDQEADHFLDLIKKSRKGKLKIYIGMSAGVGKSFRMLQEARTLLQNGIDVKIGFIEPHGRAETVALTDGLPLIPRTRVFYKGKELEEMDLQAVLNLRPEVVIVDELAHTNIPGSKNEKRWQDVMDILDAGINVITAVNIQHIESLNDIVKQITGIEVTERIPDKILKLADEVVNIDLTADELIARLKQGKIYAPEKVELALRNFFKSDSILQLRELALKEVAGQIERKVETEIPRNISYRHEKILACISSNEKTAKTVIRKTARLANYYNAQWYALYIETPSESPEKIALDKQRYLINNFKLATELGAEVSTMKSNNVATSIAEAAEAKNITTVCIGKPTMGLAKIILATNVFNQLLKKLSENKIDLIIMS
ncbi:MAG TPA: sensor histidine kinase KdpD [Flavipsychrobacter sp.]|nr:sensor histidine kinase KdpD [Flavipsychrobacter sp.]